MVSQHIGGYAFLLGAVIALITGVFGGAFAQYSGIILLVLVLLGLLVGFLNIGDKEVDRFLVAAIALLLVGSAELTAINGVVGGLGTVLNAIVNNLGVFVAPAALIVALKSIYGMAKN